MHPSSFHLWSSKYPTEKRSRLSRGLLGPHAGIITPKEDELVKYFITKPEETLPWGLFYNRVLSPLVRLLPGGTTGELLIREDWHQAHLWLRGGLVWESIEIWSCPFSVFSATLLVDWLLKEVFKRHIVRHLVTKYNKLIFVYKEMSERIIHSTLCI